MVNGVKPRFGRCAGLHNLAYTNVLEIKSSESTILI
jgi:hypothetical protein